MVELGLRLFVLVECTSHVLLDTLLLLLELAYNRVVFFLFLLVINFDLRHFLPQRAHLLDVWRQFRLLLLHLLFDLVDEGGHLLE